MIRNSLILAIIIGVCIALTIIIIGRSESDVEHRIEDKGQKTEEKILTSDPCIPFSETCWPMFRGGQRLLGKAQGSLSDSLALKWKFKTDGEIKSSPAIDNGLVFVGSSDANVYAVDLENGRQAWKYHTEDAVEASPCVIEETVFIGSSDDFLYALDAKTGQLRWKYETDGQILGAANWTKSPDGHRAWIILGSYDNKLHCVDSTNGNVMWTYETDNYINGSPAVGDGKTVFGGCDAMIHVVSLADGSRIKQIDTSSFIAASAAFFEGRVYVGNYDNIFICADIASGEIEWKYTSEEAPFFSSPAVDKNIVVFGGRDKHVHCLRRDDGQFLWKFKTLGEVDSSPVICEDKIVVGSEDGRLYMIRLSDGSQIWSYEIGHAITSSPAVAKGMIVIGSDDGYLYAFGAN